MFEKIALYARALPENAQDTLRRAVKILSVKGFTLFAERDLAADLGVCGVTREELFETCDLALSFGGDGTMLSAARLSSEKGTPILGVNLGHIGFLTALELRDLDRLSELNAGAFYTEERMMLKITVQNKTYHALNEACIVHKNPLGVTEFDVSVDDTLIGRYRSDGVIIASPTGSTAYSLSAGGPVVDPRVQCLCITPICAHSLLHTRPIIEPPQAKITLSGISGKGGAELCVDGEIQIELGGDDLVTIEKSERVTRLLRLKSHSFCKVLYQKLNEREEA